jgi:hypothetical protein
LNSPVAPIPCWKVRPFSKYILKQTTEFLIENTNKMERFAREFPNDEHGLLEQPEE